MKNPQPSILIRMIIIMTVFILSSCASSSDNALSLMQKIQESTASIDTVYSETVLRPYDGITLTETTFSCQQKLNHMFILQVKTDAGYTLRPSTPDDEYVKGKTQDILGQSEVVAKNGSKVLYGVNADVFGSFREDMPGLLVPMGLVIADGEVYQSFHHHNAENLFCVRNDGTADIIKYSDFAQDSISIRQAVGAWHTLIWDGQKAEAPEDILGLGYHPRTFIGVSEDRREVLIFVVDGRQPQWSEGLQMRDMIDICAGAGCYRAANLDGGGSTTFVAKTEDGYKVINSPSDEGNKARPVVNGLLVIEE